MKTAPRQHFSKYSGCGNDFILLDNRQKSFPSSCKKSIAALCHRQLGIGADGVILVEHSTNADIRMRIFNSDGSEAEMCGNGIRCFKKYLHELQFKAPCYRIQTFHNILTVKDLQENVQVGLQISSLPIRSVLIPLDRKERRGFFLDTGVPHLVFFVEPEEFEHIDLNCVAPALRYHPLFAPGGTNVNICKITGMTEIAIRTYERGVERETLACGTGSAAGAIIAGLHYETSQPVNVRVASGERLSFTFDIQKGGCKNLTMTGPAHWLYSGYFEWPKILASNLLQ